MSAKIVQIAPQPRETEYIYVAINGQEYPTYFDRSGVQRFSANSALKLLQVSNRLNLSWLRDQWKRGLVHIDDMVEIYAFLGYSLEAFRELDVARGLSFENPAEKDYR